MLASGVGPTVTAGRTIVGSAMSGGRGFMNTLTGPATNAAGSQGARIGGQLAMTAEQGFIATGTIARTTATTASNAATNASRQFASQALSYGGAYTGVSFAAGAAVGLMTETDVSSSFPSGNPLFLPFEGGNQVGGLLNKGYNAMSQFFNQPVSTNFK